MTSLSSEGVKRAMERTDCLTSVDVMAGPCCCAAQQEGRVWLCGAGFGQRLQEDCFGCAAYRHVDALSSKVIRQRRDANLYSAFFISFFITRVGRFILRS